MFHHSFYLFINFISFIWNYETKYPILFQFDVIVSTWMGQCLFSLSRLPSLLKARDENLKEGGVIMPGMVQLRIACVMFEI